MDRDVSYLGQVKGSWRVSIHQDGTFYVFSELGGIYSFDPSSSTCTCVPGTENIKGRGIVDSDGSILIADKINHCIRRFSRKK